MKVRKSLVLAGLAGGLAAATSVSAQTIVYNNTTTPLPNLTGAVAAGAANGYELGDEVVLACGPRELTEITIIFHVLGAAAGTANTQVRVYAGGAAPGIPIWDSGVMAAMPHTAGLNNLVLPVPNVVVPDEVIWTIQHTNRTGSVEAMGPRLYHPPTVGSSEDYFWAFDAPNFPGWTSLWYGGTPTANFGSRLVASGTVGSGACCLPDGTCAVMTECDCENQDGLYQGDGTLCNQVFCREPGACCMPIGDCFITAQHVCEAQGGTYSGDAVTCATANCEVPGACCMPGNECVIMTQNDCTTAGGTYNGAGSNCGAAGCSQPPILHNNGPLSTGEFTSQFTQAPPGTTWSEIAGVPGCANINFGYGITGARIADDFVVPEPWTIEEIDVFGYVTLTAPQNPPVSPFTGGNLRIWDGPPGATGSNIVFGDTTTNRLVSSTFSNIYRTAATGTELRPVFRNKLSVGTTLQPGTYWVDYNLTASGTGFSPPVTITGIRGPAGANALQQVGAGAWTPMQDLGACEIPRAQDSAFILYGEIGGEVCYANCDESTVPPILNVDDFTCFINAFAAAQGLPHAQQVTHYSNCDESTVAPVLNVDDFTCFINAFAAGCP